MNNDDERLKFLYDVEIVKSVVVSVVIGIALICAVLYWIGVI